MFFSRAVLLAIFATASTGAASIDVGTPKNSGGSATYHHSSLLRKQKAKRHQLHNRKQENALPARGDKKMNGVEEDVILGADTEDRDLIVGGEVVADRDAYPWFVSLTYGGEAFCGASVIGSNLVLTAAHCVEGSSPTGLIAVLNSYCRPGASCPVSSQFRSFCVA